MSGKSVYVKQINPSLPGTSQVTSFLSLLFSGRSAQSMIDGHCSVYHEAGALVRVYVHIHIFTYSMYKLLLLTFSEAH